jgi:thiol-disulfide isomerase/thioredoxin
VIPPRARIGIAIAAAVVVAAGAATRRRPPQGLPPLLEDRRTGEGPRRIVLDTLAPREPVTLLFFDGRASSPSTGGRRSVVTVDGTLLEADERLNVLPRALPGLGSAVLSAAATDDGGWWLGLLDGSLVRIDSGARRQTAVSMPLGAASLWPATDGGVAVARSPDRFGFLPEADSSPLVVTVDTRGRVQGRGVTVVPSHGLLATLANSGHVVASGDTMFFAPVSRSEVIALSARGNTIWQTDTTAEPATPEPRFVVTDGAVRIDYQPFTLGLTLGPDGNLYRLRAADSAVSRATLDVIERTTGRLLASVTLASPRPTLAANARGRLYGLDAGTLLGALPPGRRVAFPLFALQSNLDRHVTLEEQRGRMVLINFWASWCAPCRTEMPALDSLQRALEGPDFALLALNADAERRDADRFLTEIGRTFTVLYGGPSLSSRYHYPGLPYTVLVDGEGRVVRRWIGQLSPGDMDAIRLLVRSEPASEAVPSPSGSRLHAH